MIIKLLNDFENNIVIKEDIEDILNKRNYWGNFRNKSILLTGAYGSIARYLSYFLINLNKNFGYNIKLFLNGRNPQKMEYYFGKYYNYFTPILDDLSSGTDKLPNSLDYIIHAASNARPELFYTKPVETIVPNVITLYGLLDKYRNAKFLFFSTGSVYGNIDAEIIEEDSYGVINFSDLMSSYAESKRIGELLCKSYAQEYNVDTRIVRIHHTYGPTLDLFDDNRAFSYFVKCALTNKDIVLNSNGLAKRAFLYIKDAILAFFDILILGDKGESYNLSADKMITIKDLANVICSFNKNIKLCIKIKDDYVDVNSNRTTISSVDKLKKLGWEQSVSVEEGFKRTIESFKQMSN